MRVVLVYGQAKLAKSYSTAEHIAVRLASSSHLSEISLPLAESSERSARDELDGAETIVLAMPDDDSTTSGSLIALLDAYFLSYHLSTLHEVIARKNVVIVSKPKSERAKEVYAACLSWRVYRIYSFSLYGRSIDEKRIERLKKRIERNNGRVSLHSRFSFFRELLTGTSHPSLSYWLEKGWIKRKNHDAHSHS